VLSSLGAGLSLVVAGVIALVIVSGVVAFRGWPGMRSDDRAAAVRVASVAAPEAAEDAEPVVVGSDSGTRRSARAARRGGPVASRGSSARRAGRDRTGDSRRPGTRSAGGGAREDADDAPGGSRGSDGSDGSGSRGSGPGSGSGGSGGSGSAPAGSGAPAVPRTPDPVGRAVEGVDRIVDNVTEPKPEGSPPVDVPGVVEDTTQTVDEVVEDTKPTVDETVEGTTQVVEDVVDGTGGAVKDILP